MWGSTAVTERPPPTGSGDRPLPAPVDERRARLVDIGLAGLVIVAVGTSVTADLGTGAGPGPLAYGFAVGLGGLVLLRRRWPVGSLLVTVAALLLYYRLGLPPVGLAVPVAAALYSAAEQGRLRWAAGTAAGLIVVSTAVRAAQGDDLALMLGFELPTSAGLMAAVVALGDAVRARRGWQTELRRRALSASWEREREATRRVEQERLRIARELHDLLAHSTSIIALHSDVARESLRDDPAAAERSLTAVRAACRSVTRELRATLGALREGRDEDPDPGTGLDHLDSLVEPARATGLDVRVVETGARQVVPSVTDTAGYRVVQEALSNVLRHADARTVTIELDHRDGELMIRVRDDGHPAGPGGETVTTGSGWGLIGMRERLALLGGTLRTERQLDGFVVEARLPREDP